MITPHALSGDRPLQSDRVTIAYFPDAAADSVRLVAAPLPGLPGA